MAANPSAVITAGGAMSRGVIVTGFLLCSCVLVANAQYYYNRAALFDGSTSYIAVPDDPELTPDSAITVEAWVYPTGYNQYTTSAIVSKNARGSYALVLNEIGQVIFYPIGDPGSWVISKSTTHIPLNTWTHIAGTYDGTTTAIVINGKLDTSIDYIRGPIAHNADSLYIGGENFNGVFLADFKGAIDEVRIWNRALGANTIQFQMSMPLAMVNPSQNGRYAGLLNAWRLNANALDEAGSKQNNGDAHNITYWDLRRSTVNYLDYNNTLMLDTRDAYCVAAANPAFDATTSLTLEAWVNEAFPSDSSFQTIIVKGGEASWDYGLFSNPVAPRTYAGFRIIFAIGMGDTIGSPVIPEFRWVHVAATYNSVTRVAVIYINGDSVAGRAFATAGLIPDDPDSLFIGNFRPSQQRYQFSGQIDQVRIWKNVVRTRDQIKGGMYTSYDFSSIGIPGSSLTEYSFDGRNTNEMGQFEGPPILDFVGGARMTSEHMQLGGEATSPILRDDYEGFPGPTFYMGKKELDVPWNDPAGLVDSVYVATGGPATNMKMFLLLNHPTISGLDISLTSPSGLSATIFQKGEGGYTRDIMTIVSDAADTMGLSGPGVGFEGPCSPLLKPISPMSTFVGQPRQGWWKLRIVDGSGYNAGGVLYAWGLETYPTTGVPMNETPGVFSLEQNYPNPFNPTTTIQYTVAGARGQGLGASEVRIVMYDLLGREIATLVNARQAPGTYKVMFDGSRFASGVYFYRLNAGTFSTVRKMTLVK